MKDPLEGFLYPSSYAAAKGQKPETVLKEMVSRANDKYERARPRQEGEEPGTRQPLAGLTVASLVQAEGTSHDDFRKMAEVVYNRLKPGNPETYGSLEFDSTYNYVKNQSKIDMSDRRAHGSTTTRTTRTTSRACRPGPSTIPVRTRSRARSNRRTTAGTTSSRWTARPDKFTEDARRAQQAQVDEFNASRKKG